MTAAQIIFLVVAFFTLGSGLMVVTTSNLIHAALWLVSTLFGVAVVFALLNANFLAIVQVVVYIGAIAILFIFAVMLTRHVMNDDAVQTTKNWLPALAAVLIVFGGIAAAALPWTRLQVGPGLPPSDSLLLDFGSALINPQHFAIPFEVSSVLLLAALIGASYVSVERKGGKG